MIANAAAIAAAALVVAAVGGSNAGAAGACTAVYTGGTLAAFVAHLQPGDVGCAEGTFAEGFVASNPGWTLRGPRILGSLHLTSTANDVTLEDVYVNNRAVTKAWAVLVQGDRVTLRRVEVTNGNKPGSKTDGICVLAGFGFEQDSANTAVNLLVERSRLHNCGDDSHEHGIYLESTRNAIVRDSYLYGSGGEGVQLYPDAQGSLIEHNVVDGNSRDYKANIMLAGERKRGEYRSPHGSSNNRIVFNILTFPETRYNVDSYYPRGSLPPIGNEVAFNCAFGAPMGDFGATNAYSAHDNFHADPRYTDRAAGDYSLREGSPCAGLGPR